MKSLRQDQRLHQVERWKLARHPLDVQQSLIDVYAKEGPASIHQVEGEVERLKWVGVYPQRQGGDAFMLRIKLPGGRLTAAQAREIGAITSEHARGPEPSPVFGDTYLDLTTRQDVQLHWIKIGAIPEIWRRLEAVGITTVQACGDSARNVLCCPVSGIDRDEFVPAYPIAAAISDFFTGNREYANLPRKFKMSVTGCGDDCAQAEINDIGLVPARLTNGTLGFNLLVGGGLSDGPRMASDVDVFVAPDDAVEITRAVAQLYGELGNRENRWANRLRYLVQELGPERFRSELANRARISLTPAGEHLTKRYRGDHIGVHPQRQPGLFYAGLNVTVGRMQGTDLIEAARLAEHYGDGEIRLATDQNFILTGIPEGRLDDLLAEPLLETYSPSPKPFARGMVACTGNEFCRLAIVETKARAAAWARELDSQVAIAGDDIIRMHFSGCSASCAQPQIADIGFRGETAKRGDAIVEAVDIGLGGSLGRDAAFIDWIDGARPVSEVPAAMRSLFERYTADRYDGERFHEWARRTPNPDLQSILRNASYGANGERR
ncbi:MAG: ferredoxin--nitrite reductase [Chloroflexia bacterium]|nr:ferredoxin--nitrite reductase [Chloroflexia bacterium]MDQ3411827.1 ferredoxin--nitrite reductase [Chloroflexota bacterium]